VTGAPLGWHQDGRLHFALGIEDTFVPQSAPGERPIDEYELTDHYRQWGEDLDRVKGSGARLLRWGVPWYRVNPEPGVFDWSWVDPVIDRQVELGIEPIVDLLHYGTPLWLDQQFANPDFPDRFADYAVRFADRYGDSVTSYTPVNEPMIHAQFAGEYAYWPPYLTGQAGLNRIAVAVALASARAQRGIREVIGERAVFVHVDAGFRYVGAIDDPEHRDQAARMLEQRYLAEDLLTGRVSQGHPLLNDLLAADIPERALAELADSPTPPDVMGVNYYPLHSTEVFEAGVRHGGGFRDPRPTRNDGVAGMREVLADYERRYGVPVMLTETCVTASVDRRLDWLDASVDAIDAMRAEGRRVVGYTWWPLFDMYEWTWRHSTKPRQDFLLSMGLYDLRETDAGLQRQKNALADRFRQHAIDHAAQPALEAATAQED
jgi:beta-glucosidase